MAFAVVVLSKSRENLIPCLRAVGEKNPGTWRVVVDDGVDLPAAEGAEFDGLYEQVVTGAKPFVFARNCNLAMRAVAPLDVILLNDDALLVTPGGFTALAAQAEQHPEYGVIGATTNVTGQPLQYPQGVGLRDVTHIAYVCTYIPRRTIDRVGMLDERYCLDYGVEDRDHCEAIRRAGLKVGVYDGCYVDHGRLKSSFRGDPQAPAQFARNYALFLQKWGLPS